MTEMNVTNLLDTAFILLMAFMIVAPAIKHGIELDLPEVGAGNLDTKKTVTVVLEKRPFEEASDRIYIEGRRVTPQQLTAEIQKLQRVFPELDVVIEGDREAIYGTFALAIAAIQDAGVRNVGLVTQPLPPEPPAPGAD
jgi:biopolymer transport protein ExbD